MGAQPSIGEASDRLSRTCSLVDDVGILRYAKGARKEALKRLGLERVRDVLLHVPNRYLDFSHMSDIAHADVGQSVTIVGIVENVRLKRPRPRLQIVEVDVSDATGIVQASFFRQPWIADRVHKGESIVLSGTIGFAYGFKQMKSPFYEVLGDAREAEAHARILPVHPVGENISASWMRRIVSAALADWGDVCDFLPTELVAKRHLMSYARALRAVHFPQSMEQKEAARRRLAYNELLCLQLALLTRQRVALEGTTPAVHTIDGPRRAALMKALPFDLTDEQKTAVNDIAHDMASPRVMNRLLLGDVGTGKTAVAAVALAICADSGTQAAMMAPTSVLARQYAERIGPLLDAAGISWVLITGSTPAAERADAAERLATGDIVVAFGTTALLSDDIDFVQLSLVIVDEQHRFGVNQRSALRKKGAGADLLTMTATPIPRTLALSVYGDLSCSRITQRPNPGAGISTKAIAPENEDLALTAIADAVAAGRQAYVICPLVDDSDDGSSLDDVPASAYSNAKTIHSAVSTQKRLARQVFPSLEVGLLTGRLSAAEKDEVMARFREGTINVLVSTTVVEVGVDVPNATVMLVYDADRFGLATLHQLRGRVGRGNVPGMVYLECVAKRGTPARQRLDALESTSDGFELAELDLRLRHEGEVLGYRQSGGATLHICDLSTDADLVEAAHEDSRAISDVDPELRDMRHRCLALEMRDCFGAYFEEVGRA